MPKIPPHVIDSVFYLYASREDALAGKEPGGTNLIVKYASVLNPEAAVLWRDDLACRLRWRIFGHPIE